MTTPAQERAVETAKPFRCPHCAATFGFGPDAVLLHVATSVPFDEPTPCCGKRVTGTLGRNGEVMFDER